MRTSCLLLCSGILLATPVRAAVPVKVEPNAGPLFESASGAFFALSVGDLDATTKWYSEKLGLKVMMRVPKRDKSAVTVLEGGGLTVELVQHDDALPLSKAAPSVSDPGLIYGIFKVGVVVEDFEGVLARLRERGVPFVAGPFPATASQRANVLIRDNSGNLIQLFGK